MIWINGKDRTTIKTLIIKDSINTVDRLKRSIKKSFNINETHPVKKIILYNIDGTVTDDIDVVNLVSENILFISYNCK